MSKSDSSLSETQVRVDINDQSHVVELDTDPEDTSANPVVSVAHIHGDSWSVLFQGRSISATLTDRSKNILTFSIDGVLYNCKVTNRRAQLLADLGVDINSNEHDGDILAPMPGLLINLHVSPGDTVSEGDALVVLEAMKMENQILAPFDARVTEVLAQPGESVAKNATLIKLEHV